MQKCTRGGLRGAIALLCSLVFKWGLLAMHPKKLQASWLGAQICKPLFSNRENTKFLVRKVSFEWSKLENDKSGNWGPLHGNRGRIVIHITCEYTLRAYSN